MGYIGQAPTKVPLTSADITDGTIALADMAANSVDSDQYVDGSIDAAHLSANSIDSDAYVDGSIDEAHMSANSIDSDSYVDGSIDNAHLADDAVGVAELSATGTASSSTFLRGDNAWAAAGGGAWTFLATATASGSSEIEFDDFMDGTYDVYMMLIMGVYCSVDPAEFDLLFSDDGGSSYMVGTSYHHGTHIIPSSGTVTVDQSQSQASIVLGGRGTELNGTNEDGCYTLTFTNMDANTRPSIHGTFVHRDDVSGNVAGGVTWGSVGGSNATIESFKFLYNTGNINTGEFYFYGVNKS
jgi:hypothetical protein